MALNEQEKMLAEAIDSMLQQDAKLGLSIHDEEDFKPSERGYEYLHNQIDDMFAIKAAELNHYTGVKQAFSKVHNYKYIDDPSFKTAMKKEMVAQGIPEAERNKAISFIDEVIDDVESDEEWAEKDFGFHPELDEVMSMPDELMDGEFEIEEVEDWPTDANVEEEDI